MFIWEGCLTLWLRDWAVFSGRVLIRAGVLFNDQAQHIPPCFFFIDTHISYLKSYSSRK